MAITMGWANAEQYASVGQPIPFDLLLRKHDDDDSGTGRKNPSKATTQSKKHRTWVGAITTLNGLEKAIRRYFSASDAGRIIKAKAMTPDEWRSLLQAQNNAVQGRAAKRVKSRPE